MLLPLAVLQGCASFDGFKGTSAAQPEPTETAVPLQDRVPLEPISRNTFFLESVHQSVIGEPQIVFTREEDTFSDLAREYGLGYDELVAANPGIDPWLPGEGVAVLLPTQYILPDVPRRGVILNIASRRLFYFPPVDEGELIQVMTYPIGIGRVGWETPLGETTLIAKARDPSWYVPASVRQEHAAAGNPIASVVPAGPDNPLGKFVLKLDMPGYLIHGTNQPYGVGMRVSHGCVRLYPENIEKLYSLVEIGETVQIINRPYLAGWRNGELYFESHTPLEDDALSSTEQLDTMFDEISQRSNILFDDAVRVNAQTIAGDARGIPVRVSEYDVDEVYARARVVRNTIEFDPDAPTLAEVRALLDAPVDEPAE
jgi:L,D-transpeptidase ErfK/SrfK